MAVPEVDEIEGLPPAVALPQQRALKRKEEPSYQGTFTGARCVASQAVIQPEIVTC
jgi:excinuclease UvrABC ATPase subunit